MILYINSITETNITEVNNIVYKKLILIKNVITYIDQNVKKNVIIKIIINHASLKNILLQ